MSKTDQKLNEAIDEDIEMNTADEKQEEELKTQTVATELNF